MAFKLQRKITALISLEFCFEQNVKIIRDGDIATCNTATCTIEMHRMNFSFKKKSGEKEKYENPKWPPKIQDGGHNI